jgi:hypothetical protein
LHEGVLLLFKIQIGPKGTGSQHYPKIPSKMVLTRQMLPIARRQYFLKLFGSVASSRSDAEKSQSQSPQSDVLRTRRSSPNPPKRTFFYQKVLRHHASAAIFTHHVVGVVSLSLWSSAILALGGENLIPICIEVWKSLGVSTPPQDSLQLQLYIAFTCHKLGFPLRFPATVLSTPRMAEWIVATNPKWIPQFIKNSIY